MSDHPTSKHAKAKRNDANRSQKHRDKCKEDGVPTTHVLNRGLVEGFFYEVAKQHNAGVAFKDMQVSPRWAIGYALRILTAQTNGTDQYDHDATLDTIRKRIDRECSTPFRIDFLPNSSPDGTSEKN